MVLRSLLKMGMHNTFFTSVESYQPNIMFATFHYLTHVGGCVYMYSQILAALLELCCRAVQAVMYTHMRDTYVLLTLP